MADDAPPELPLREGATPPEFPPRESVEALSLADDVADLDAAADEGYEEEAADAAEALQEAPLTEEEEEARHLYTYKLPIDRPGGYYWQCLCPAGISVRGRVLRCLCPAEISVRGRDFSVPPGSLCVTETST